MGMGAIGLKSSVTGRSKTDGGKDSGPVAGGEDVEQTQHPPDDAIGARDRARRAERLARLIQPVRVVDQGQAAQRERSIIELVVGVRGLSE